jgi:hypothetical protein
LSIPSDSPVLTMMIRAAFITANVPKKPQIGFPQQVMLSD